MTKVLFKRKNSDEIATLPVEDGALIYNYETGATYLDYNDERIPTGGGMPTGDTFPIGAITTYGGSTAPTNWLICDGSAVSRTTYADLFDAIGTTYGSGDGSTTFNLPNLKGKVAVGQDTTQTEFDVLGETGGEKTHTLTVDEIPEHSHLISNPSVSGIYPQTHNLPSNSGTNNTFGGSEMTTRVAGGDQAHNNLQPYIILNYIIKAYQSSGTVANVVTTKTTSDTDTYSCNYINGIVESGSNTNGNYVKYVDGTMICYKHANFGTLAFGTEWGSLYESSQLDLGDFPVPFVGNYPVVNLMPARSYFLDRAQSFSLTSWGKFWACRPVSDTQVIEVYCMAIGRWK